jgi:1,4-dihydroxy-2-naphthoate octaprenyltransferase
MNAPNPLLGPMRVPFLILTPSCVFLGFASAFSTSGHVNLLYLFLVIAGALCAHISVNCLNEYFDFKSGLDFKTKRTPFSGGSGTLPGRPEKAQLALGTGLVTLGITAIIGLYFLYARGLFLLPLGLIGLLLIITYTTWITRNPFLCLIAPGLGFGPFMVMGTDFVLTGAYSYAGFFSSLVPFFLVSDLLLLNQFPDVDADRSIGRKHLPIVAGIKVSAIIYGVFLLMAYLTIAVGALLGFLPPFTLIGLVSLIIAIPAFLGAFRHASDRKNLKPHMGMNVIINILTPILVGIGFLVG